VFALPDILRSVSWSLSESIMSSKIFFSTGVFSDWFVDVASDVKHSFKLASVHSTSMD
jgi:hypothetical protein